MHWFKNLFLQRSTDERLEHVKAEVAGVKQEVATLKRRTEALEAFNNIAKGTRP